MNGITSISDRKLGFREGTPEEAVRALSDELGDPASSNPYNLAPETNCDANCFAIPLSFFKLRKEDQVERTALPT
jgi:hypothetical protein